MASDIVRGFLISRRFGSVTVTIAVQRWSGLRFFSKGWFDPELLRAVRLAQVGIIGVPVA